MNKGNVALSVVLSALAAVCSYVMTLNILFPTVTFALYLSVMLFFVVPRGTKYAERERKGHECYRFINTFVINMSVTKSIGKAFEAATSDATGDLKALIDAVSENDDRRKVRFLADYFDSDLYEMFLALYTVHEEQGGEIIDTCRELIGELTRVEESSMEKAKQGAKALKEYIIMWLFSVVIFMFMRFGLSNFFDSLKENAVYLAGVGTFLGFLLLSVAVYGYFYCPLDKRVRKGSVDEFA